jgi:hypothetical protein
MYGEQAKRAAVIGQGGLVLFPRLLDPAYISSASLRDRLLSCRVVCVCVSCVSCGVSCVFFACAYCKRCGQSPDEVDQLSTPASVLSMQPGGPQRRLLLLRHALPGPARDGTQPLYVPSHSQLARRQCHPGIPSMLNAICACACAVVRAVTLSLKPNAAERMQEIPGVDLVSVTSSCVAVWRQRCTAALHLRPTFLIILIL